MAKTPPRTGKRPTRLSPRATAPGDRRRLTEGRAQSSDYGVRKRAPAEREVSVAVNEDNIPRLNDSDEKIVAQGVSRYQAAATAWAPQRARELEDLLFDRALPEDQWPRAIWQDRQGGRQEDGTTTEARPCLVIPKLDQPVQQVWNEIVNSNLGIGIIAKTGAGRKQAEVRQGIIRCIEQDSLAHTAYNWGGGRMLKCGFGAWRVNKKYANDGDFELDLTIDRILDQGAVLVDPYFTESTGADMNFAFIAYDYPEDVYLDKFGRTKLVQASTAENSGALQTLNSVPPDWVTTVSGQRVYRVVEYFQVIYTKDTLYQRPGGDGAPHYVFASELDTNQKTQIAALVAAKQVKKREVSRRSVRWVTMDAYSVLDREEWEGKYIPVVVDIGKEYFVNGQRCFKGIISNAKDAQRSYNYMRSAQVEAVGLAPRAPWVMAEGQDEGYELMWQQANVRNFPYLVYQPTTFEGQLVPPPQRNVAEPALQGVTLAVREADADIKATTGRFDPSLGQAKGDQSGKAITALQRQGESSTSNYIDSHALAITYTGMILNDMLEYVYNTPGRIARVLGEEGKEKSVLLNTPFKYNPEGEPEPAHEDDPDAEFYDLSEGSFLTRVKPTKSYATQQEEAFNVMNAIGQSAPQLVPSFADLWVEQLDTPVARVIAERLRAQNPSLQQEEGAAQLPPRAQAMVNKLQQQVKELSGQHEQLVSELEKATSALKGRQVEAQAEAEAKQQTEILRIRTDKQIKAAELMSSDKQNLIEQRVKLLIEYAKLEAGAAKTELEAEMTRLQGEIDRRHEFVMQLAQQDADQRAQGQDQGHELAMTMADRLTQPAEDEDAEDGDLPPAPAAARFQPPAMNPIAPMNDEGEPA